MIFFRLFRLQIVIAYAFLLIGASAFYKSASLKHRQIESSSRPTDHELQRTILTSAVRATLRTTERFSSTFLEDSSSSSQLAAFKFKNFEEMLHAFRDEPVLIYFTSVTCGPCKLQKKELANVREIVGADLAIKVISIDTKKWPHVGSKFAIGKLPCLLVVKDKEVLLRLEGLTMAEELVEKVYSDLFFNYDQLL